MNVLKADAGSNVLDNVREAVMTGQVAGLASLGSMARDHGLDTLRSAYSVAAGNLDTVRTIAETGVHYISVGALTHSAPAADLSLLIEPLDEA